MRWITEFVRGTFRLPEASQRTIGLVGLLLVIGLPALYSSLEYLVTLAGQKRSIAIFLLIFLGTVVAALSSARDDRTRAKARIRQPIDAPLTPRAEVIIATSGATLKDHHLALLQGGTLEELAERLHGLPPADVPPWLSIFIHAAAFHRPTLRRLTIVYTEVKGRLGQDGDTMQALVSELRRLLQDPMAARNAPHIEAQCAPTMDNAEEIFHRVVGLLSSSTPAADCVVEVTPGTSSWTAGATLAATWHGVDVSFVPQAADEHGVRPRPWPRRLVTDAAIRLWQDDPG